MVCTSGNEGLVDVEVQGSSSEEPDGAEQVVYGDHGQVCSHGILFPPEAVIVWNLSTLRIKLNVVSYIVLHAAPSYEPLLKPCSLTKSDMVEEVEGPTQADSYEVDNYDVDSRSLNEQ
ncbi:hypothetical protein Tco_0950827, partial [Tanacetum coccineum]